jgi:UDP-N-acetylmuramoyl-tripeptide--D-alanyl-D-alanine ligase
MVENIGLIFSQIVFVLVLGWYFITLMQWYSYKIERVIFHHKKVLWHIFYFVVPVLVYYITLSSPLFWIYFYIGFLPSFLLWQRKLDKKLVLTGRVKRFFSFLIFLVALELVALQTISGFNHFDVLLPLVLAAFASSGIEKFFFYRYKLQAYHKLQSRDDLKVISITASFGKTSMKNILTHILSSHFNVYATPRSVNTLAGLVKDVNSDLPEKCDIYITEAGARERGDIAEIAHFLEPHYAIIGQVGEQHIEYFKTLENIIDTKRELLFSPRLLDAFIDQSAALDNDKDQGFMILSEGKNIKLSNVQGDLSGISFDLDVNGDHFTLKAPLLGRFNCVNIALCVACALKLGVTKEEITKAVSTLAPTPHRLQRIDAGGKIILDDSFNGNFEGMMEGVALCDTHEGRRVIITPGIVESTVEDNHRLGVEIDRVFDLVIITGGLNSQTLCDAIENSEKIRLRDKSRLQEILGQKTRAGDVIYFANDAPNFI